MPNTSWCAVTCHAYNANTHAGTHLRLLCLQEGCHRLLGLNEMLGAFAAGVAFTAAVNAAARLAELQIQVRDFYLLPRCAVDVCCTQNDRLLPAMRSRCVLVYPLCIIQHLQPVGSW